MVSELFQLVVEVLYRRFLLLQQFCDERLFAVLQGLFLGEEFFDVLGPGGLRKRVLFYASQRYSKRSLSDRSRTDSDCFNSLMRCANASISSAT